MGNVTYYGYEEGYDMRILRLGNLAFDFANPKIRMPYIHEPLVDQELEKWTTSDERPVCYMAAHNGRHFSMGLGLQDFLNFDSSKSKDSYTLVVGKDGSKVELIEPNKFFNENVLTNENARFWLESRLAVVRKLQILKGYLGLTPNIWLLTGLYYITDAVTFSAHGTSSEGDYGGSVPLPEPTGLASLLQLKIGSKVRIGHNTIIQRGTQINGRKVWAAQWQRVDAKYQAVARWEENLGARQLKLLELYSSQTVRAPTGEVVVADVTLCSDEGIEAVSATVQGEAEDYWEVFDKEVEKVEDDYKE